VNVLHHDPGGAGSSTPNGSPSSRVIIALVALDVLLMLFCVVLWRFGAEAMAATAAAGAVALTVEIARRLMASTEPTAPVVPIVASPRPPVPPSAIEAAVVRPELPAAPAERAA
jgi:hypothetical protein